MPITKSYFDGHPDLHVAQDTIDAQVDSYKRIVDLAEKAGLISSAVRGVMVLVHPAVQLENAIYHRIQVATGNRWRLEKADDKEIAKCQKQSD